MVLSNESSVSCLEHSLEFNFKNARSECSILVTFEKNSLCTFKKLVPYSSTEIKIHIFSSSFFCLMTVKVFQIIYVVYVICCCH